MIHAAFDIIGNLLVIYLVFVFPAMLLLLVYSHICMPKRLREELLRPPFFSQGELDRLSVFPLSLLKTLAVVRAVAAPATMRRRLGSYDLTGKVPEHFRTTSRLLVLLVMAGAMICLMSALSGALLEIK